MPERSASMKAHARDGGVFGCSRSALSVSTAGAMLLFLGGCFSLAPTAHDRLELENISIANIVPKSSPTSFVKTFGQFCTKGASAPSQLAATLRAAGYVEAPTAKGSRFRHFVVDDRRPAVAISTRDGAIFCAVSAVARTGQYDRTGRYVADHFPGARKIDATRISNKAERAWRIDGNGTSLVFTLRDQLPGARSTYSLVYYRRG